MEINQLKLPGVIAVEIQCLSTLFGVRMLGQKDIDIIYDLSCGNVLFYQYHPPFVTKESIEADMKALPPGKSPDDKFFIGFFKDDDLIAVMDLILDYPAEKTAFIGLFMMNRMYQGRGLGSAIVGECISHLRAEGFTSVRLGTDKGNLQSNAFWSKNGFARVEESGQYIIRELTI